MIESLVSTRLRDERGGVLVMVAVWLPLLLLFASFVVDVGNRFEHKRHLQTQADAGALAGGDAFGGVFTGCNDTAIENEARRYAGDPTAATQPPYNSQVAPTQPSNVHVLINSRGYWGDPGAANFSDGGTPCATQFVDLKITETNLPWYFDVARLFGASALPLFPINAHARVSIKALSTSEGALPVGVPDVNPKTAAATFVDETTGNVIATTPLADQGVVGGLHVFDNASAPVAVSIPSDKIGVRIALGGASSTTCGQPLVECYDGVDFARGYVLSGNGAPPNTPIARSVSLFQGPSCSDPYFSSTAQTCTSVGVQAKVDIGSLAPANARMAVFGAGCGGQNGCPLSYDAASGFWKTTTSYVPIAANAGALPLELRWEEINTTVGTSTCKKNFAGNFGGGGNPCTGTFGTVQRAYSASDATSGSLKLVQLWENGSYWANSFVRGTSHNLVVKIGVTGSLKNAADKNDPIVALRVVGGSRTQSLDCDPALSKLKDELAQGCSPEYTKNTGQTCPATPAALWATAQPWTCVAVQTGSATNQVPEGLNTRILGTAKPSSCTSPNHWSLFPNIPQGDPRVLQVFLTPFGSFSGSGSGTVPVTGFATFYITGWTGSGSGFNNPCQGNGDDPVPNNDSGVIVGHFIQYVFTLNNSGAGSGACQLGGLNSCVVVLTE